MAILGRLGSIAGQIGVTLDDFTYALRLEQDNASRHVVTAYGNAALDGSGACTFDGTGDYLNTPDSTDWDFGTNDIVIESYIYIPSANTISTDFDIRTIVCAGQASAGYQYWDLKIGQITASWGAGLRLVTSTYIGGFTNYISDDITGSFTYDAWHHLATVIKSDGSVGFYLDGASVGAASSYVSAVPDNFLDIGVSYTGSLGDYFTGYISRLAITVGSDKGWTSTFTPPVRTDPITVDANTVLALNFAGAAASTSIIDSALPDNAAAVEVLADTSSNEEHATQATGSLQPLYNSAGYLTFDGVDDYMVNTTLAQSQRFTVYTVANVTADTVAQTIFGDTTAYHGLTSAEFMTATAGSTVSDSTDRSGAKTLFAVDFNGASSTLYVNGASVATGDVGVGALSGYGLGADSGGTQPTAMNWYATFVQSGAYDSELNDVINTAYTVY